MKTSLVCKTLCCALVVAALLFAGCTETSSPSASSPAPTASPAASPAATMPPVTPVTTTPSQTQSMTPAPTTSGTSVTTIPVNSSSNGDILTIPASNRVLVTLAENPTTGYSWNISVSKGLAVVTDTYVAPNTALIGAGGYHEWLLAPDGPGTYTFNAAYMRPWEGASSAASTFSIVIEATPK